MQELIDFGASKKEINRIVQFSADELDDKIFGLNALQR